VNPIQIARTRKPLETRSPQQRRSDGIKKQATNIVLILIPLLGTLYSCYHFLHHRATGLGLSSLVVFYFLSGLGVGIGLHRFFTHRSFEAPLPVRWILGFLGSMAFQGTITRWVADHRRHHQFADHEADVHTPHKYPGHGFMVRARNLAHAHVLWMFDRDTTDVNKYAPDLIKDPVAIYCDRHYWILSAVSLVTPFLYGLVIGGTDSAAVECLLLGGFVRTTFLHNAIWA
jgi:stearoyl-CoA desaturase (Delta-9 desaturase)